jgi:O-antigen ligase
MNQVSLDSPVRQVPASAHTWGAAGVLAAAAALWLVPFLWTQHRFPLTALDSELVAAICLACGLIFCGLLPRRDTSVPWPVPAALAALFALSLVQLYLGRLTYSQDAARFMLFAGAILLAYLLGRQVVAMGKVDTAIDCLCACALAGGILSAIVQWLQLFDLEILPSWLAVVQSDMAMRQRPFANVAQANHASTYVGLAALAAVFLLGRFKAGWLLAAALLLLSSGLALAGSRMGTGFLLLLVVAVFAPTALRTESRRMRWIAALMLLLGNAIGLIAVRKVLGEFDTITRFGQPTLPIRFELWRQAWQISLQHPLLGLGVGQFAAGQYWVANAGPYTYPANNCHNLVLQVAAEFGWPAAIGVAVLALWWGVRDLRTRLANPRQAIIWAMVLFIAIHSMLEFPLWHLYFAIPTALLFAFGEPMKPVVIAMDLRRLGVVAALTILGIVLSYEAEYDVVSAVAAPFWLAAHDIRPKTSEDALGVLAVADSQLFRPEVERMEIELKHPPDEHTAGPLERSARVMRQLPAPEVIVMYIIQLAGAGRAEEAVVHAERLKVFGGPYYGAYRDWILEQTRDLGPAAAPLRHRLRELH